MQSYFCQPGSSIAGEISVPGDKSVSHRSLMLGGIAEGTTHVRGFLESEDCLATLAALRSLGVNIGRHGGNRVTIHGVGPDGFKAPAGPLDMGNAGTAMRLFMGLLAGQKFDSTLVGDASLMKRPMERVAAPLRLMNATITTQKGVPPVEILGGQQLRSVDYTLPMASAQVKSAVLLAALQAEGRTRVTEPAPTRDHTERMLGAFGVDVIRTDRTVAIEGGQTLRGTEVDVPGDFSSAAFFLVLGALAAKKGLTLRNVGINPTRTGLLDMLTMMGATLRVRPKPMAQNQGRAVGEPVADIDVEAGALRGITVPDALVPLSIDEFPVFFIAAACAEGETLVRGAHELRVKESDRLAVMAEGLARLGVEHELLPDGIWIRGGNGFSGGTIDSHGDHRIAMAFAIASVRASGPLEIRDVANVATSFPGFVQISRSAGLQIDAA
jgi:prephenate dehydrogenase/3-phosphoshikimate 1-carboxyvinyltransferase